MKLLAFGGPLNEQVVYVPNEQRHVVAALPMVPASNLAADEYAVLADAPPHGHVHRREGWMARRQRMHSPAVP